MDAIVKSFPKPPLSDHVRAAPAPAVPQPSREEAEAAVRTLIAYVGDDPDPRRPAGHAAAVRAAPTRSCSAAISECPVDVLDRTFSEIGTYDNLVLIRDIPFYSHCEHHIMPFTGKAHVAYTPVERVVGLSKIARLIDVYARRLQTQEHLTSQIATAIDEILKPRGVAVLIEAEHTCMSMRGVQKPGALTITSQFVGSFRDDAAEQVRFITLVRAGER